LKLGDTNAKGVPYRDVLAKVMGQAARLLRAGRPFDFIYLHANEKPRGYREVIQVLETGEVLHHPVE
jgi:hypothetical protein